MKTLIRDASREDIPFLAKIVLYASRGRVGKGFWDIAFPCTESYKLNIIESFLGTEAQSFCHYAGFIIAEMDDCQVGGISGFDSSEQSPTAFIEALIEVSSLKSITEEELEKIALRVDPFLNCMRQTPDKAWIVDNLAILPEYRKGFRSKRIPVQLINGIVNKGRKLGHRLGQSYTLIGSNSILSTYKRLNRGTFQEIRDSEFEDVFGAPGIVIITGPL